MKQPISLVIDNDRFVITGPRGSLTVREQYGYDDFASELSTEYGSTVTILGDVDTAAASPGILLAHRSGTLESLLGRLDEHHSADVARRTFLMLALPREVFEYTERYSLAGAIEHRRYDLWRSGREDESEGEGFYGLREVAQLGPELVVVNGRLASERYAPLSYRAGSSLPALTASYLTVYQRYLASQVDALGRETGTSE